jgi:hypothetical protein
LKLLSYSVRATPVGLRLRALIEDANGRVRTVECAAPADESKHPRAVLDLLALAEQPKKYLTPEEHDLGIEYYELYPWVKRFS